MILALAAKGKKTIAYTMLALMYFETIVPSYALGTSRNTCPVIILPVDKKPVPVVPVKTAGKKAEGGPTQPESQQFSSVNSDNMVDLFSGDMSYSIPLLDVGGYPLAIGYNSGITMDQEASWTGLGWNINPGAITRNMRGLPDDFNGLDSVKKTATVKENKTIGVTGGGDLEIAGAPIGVSASLGIFHNTYRGWGIEKSLGASINAGSKSGGSMSVGLSLTDNSQEGLTISPSLGVGLSVENAKQDGGFSGNLSTSVSYNTRSGLKALQYSAGITSYKVDNKTIEKERAANEIAAAKKEAANADGKKVNPAPVPGWTGMSGSSSVFSSGISYAFPGYTPTISMPYTSKMLTITAKVGFETKVVHPSFYISGYTTKQFIADDDKVLYLPAYGYLNYQNGVRNPGALLDFNREREIVYRERPAIPNIAVPAYTYDVFTISGEGIGGTFRAYRGDIGFVYDHNMRTRDGSTNISGDLGFGDLLHVGASVSYTRAFTETGPWRIANPLANTVGFTKSDKTYEAVYFKNPGEKTINTSSFYDAIGGDSVVIPKLYQSGDNTPDIATTNYLTKYGGGKTGTDVLLTAANVVKPARDKRTQVISYLTAKEASTVGASVYIENYELNKFEIQQYTGKFTEPTDEQEHGFRGEYYSDEKLNNYLFTKIDTSINFSNKAEMQAGTPATIDKHFSVRWTSRVKAPVTGKYTVTLRTDDGARLIVNDSSVMNFWTATIATRTCTMNLEKGQLYNIKLEYFNGLDKASAVMKWTCDTLVLTAKDFFLPTQADSFDVLAADSSVLLHKELRVNAFRKANHISEIDILNTDGQRYFYGLPVYNLKQKEATFSVNSGRGNINEGSVAYNDGVDNTVKNVNGNDRYFTSEEVPAYAHSFLLTGIVSSDYVDITGNGISDDDPGNAVKFNYSKVAGAKNPYKWRTPYSDDANYNQGLKSDSRDDKGYYVYGEKELWYLNSIESKNMIATFTVENRYDLAPINEKGVIDTGSHVAKRLKEINLYTKADFLKRNVKATPVKTVHFEYTYELCKGVNGTRKDTGKLTLKRIWFSYNGNKKGKKNAYVFNYNGKNPNYDHKSFDRWGNYKDPADNPGYTANNIVTNAEHPYSLQDSAKAAANAAAWTLDSIVLPSGGRMKITYESDDYAYIQNHRAAQMFNVAGFSPGVPVTKSDLSNRLYDKPVGFDNLYVAVDVPEQVSSKEEVYNKYLAGLDMSIAFRLHVQMPSDKFGNGYEFVPSYGRLEKDSYGFINGGHTIWFEISRITDKGKAGGLFSPMGRAAAQFLRINLPSKAYPGSDVGDDLDLADGVKVLASLADNIKNAFSSFDATARENGWAKNVDLSRSFVRLNNPGYKKYGNGLRVKKIVIYDHWNEMTGKKESVYGTEYSYTTVKNIDGVDKVISSGVATYEPVLGTEENPLHVPIEYLEQVSAWAPTDLGYVETPLGESFYPAASVGYSKVSTRSIHSKNIRSATGHEETNFYTSYDFPTISDNSLLNNDTKRRYKPGLSNFLRINAKHHLVMSQGFKVELNDMNGKVMSHYTYSETGTKFLSGTVNYYHLDDQHAAVKHLDNTVLAMNATGEIDPAASIGKDVELMMDMREQKSSSNGMSVDANVELITFGIPPVLVLPMVMLVPQSEETLFRSVAATKIISRHCILDSLVAFDKGSRVVTKNMLYDGETGDVILTGTQNEFGDTVYQFNYPAGWIYEGMSGAYKNINATLSNVNIKAGKIISNVSNATIANCFTSGDEILIYARTKIVTADCASGDSVLASFASGSKIWAVDVNALSGGDPDIYFMQQDGTPYTGSDVTMKVIRSGRKNIAASAGSVSMLKNPLVKVGNGYQLIIDKDSKIISSGVVEYGENWQVEDRKKQKIICAY